MPKIDKKLLEHLLDLSRIDMPEKEKPQLIKELGAVLKYVDKLNEVNTENVEPITGGTMIRGALREDAMDIDQKKREIAEPGRVIEGFPEGSGGYLKAPFVF